MKIPFIIVGIKLILTLIFVLADKLQKIRDK